MKQEELYTLPVFVDTEEFDRILNNEQDFVGRFVFPSNMHIYYNEVEQDGETLYLVQEYNSIHLIDEATNRSMLVEVEDMKVAPYPDEEGNEVTYSMRGKDYVSTLVVYYLGENINIEEEDKV